MRGNHVSARPLGRLRLPRRNKWDYSNSLRSSELFKRPGRMGPLERTNRRAGATPPKTALACAIRPSGEVAPGIFPCRKAASRVAPDREAANSKEGFSAPPWTARPDYMLHRHEGDPTSKSRGAALENPPTVALPLRLSVYCRRAASR